MTIYQLHLTDSETAALLKAIPRLKTELQKLTKMECDLFITVQTEAEYSTAQYYAENMLAGGERFSSPIPHWEGYDLHFDQYVCVCQINTPTQKDIDVITEIMTGISKKYTNDEYEVTALCVLLTTDKSEATQELVKQNENILIHLVDR